MFGRCGFEATTLDAVAAEAGISKPVIYDYFENKQAFFNAIVDREREVVAQRLLTAINPESDVPVVEQGVNAFFEYLRDRPDGFAAMTSHAPTSWSGTDRLSEVRREFYRARIEDVRRLLEHFDDPTDPAILTFHLMGSLSYVGQYWLSTGSGIPAEEAAKQLVQLIRFGLPAAARRG